MRPSINSLRVYLAAALSLMALTLLAFAVVYPLNVDYWDNWYVLFGGLPSVLTSIGRYAGRPLNLGGSLVSHVLMPNVAQGLDLVHVISLFVASLCLFHILRRLLAGYTWFAFLTAAIYLFYIPFNISQIVPMRNIVYSWSIVLTMLAAALFVEHAYRKGWVALVLLVGACLAAATAILSYETTFPLLAIVPMLLWLGQRKFSRRFLAACGVWYLTIAAAFAQFAIPYLQGSPSAEYQEHFTRATSLAAFAQTAIAFYNDSFPLDKMAHDLGMLVNGSYLTTALLISMIAGLCLAIFWRLGVSDGHFIPLKKLAGLLIVGLVLTGVGGFGYIIIDYLPERSMFFSAPAQALVISACIGMIALFLYRVLKVRLQVSILVLSIPCFALGCFWYYSDQVAIDLPNFSQRATFLEQMISLIPDVKPGTLIVYDCTLPLSDIYAPKPDDTYAARYLYQDRANLRVVGSIVTALLNNDGISIPSGYGDLLGPALPVNYTYDQLILIGCTDHGLEIANILPAALSLNNSLYNPYARIVPGFINQGDATILAR